MFFTDTVAVGPAFVMSWPLLDAYGDRVETTTVTCAFCGTAAPTDPAPLTWTSSTERGRLQWFCDTCSREHLRAMESKLDSEWW